MRHVLVMIMVVAIAIVATGSDATAGPGKRVRIRLKDGSRKDGYLVEKECTDQAVVLRDMRTKRKVTIPWSKVRSEQARKLRIDLGFEVAEAQGGHKIEADQIRNKAGTIFTGIILNGATAAADGVYKLKTADGVLTIRTSDVREQKKVEVDARLVYTPQELFAKKLKEKEPETAADHFQLAEYARLVGALPEAKEQYEILLRLGDPKYPAAAIQRLLDRVLKRINSAEAEALLRTIDKHIVYNRFPKAQAGLDAFKEKYGEDEDWAKEVEQRETKLTERRKEYFTAQVAKSLRDAVKDLLAAKVKTKELSLREAMTYASGELSSEDSVSREAVIQIAEKLKITQDEVVELWKERPKRALYKAFYRDGTFIVEDDLEDALAKAPKPKFPKGKEKPKMPKPRPRMTAQRWWEGKVKMRRWSDLRDFLYAVWAEKSGAVELIDPKEESCQTCAGKGYLVQTVMTQGGNVIFSDRCPTCHMATHYRIVRFR
ncbi:MAG: hypothetical protein ACYTGZ_15815 [Planctomycetota bacterium]|jgi:hypothetical protein